MYIQSPSRSTCQSINDTTPEDRGPESLQRGPVVEDQMDVVAEEGAEADAEHGGDKEEEENVELALACKTHYTN